MKLHEWLADWSSWGWPLFANHLWQSTLFAVVALSLTLLVKPSRVRYAIWLIAAAKFALPSALLVSLISALGFDFSLPLFSGPDANETTAVISQLTAPIASIQQLA